MARSKEDHAAYMREYYKTRPEQLEKKRAADRERYHQNREERLAYVKDYYKKNHAEIRARISVAGKAQRERLRDEALALYNNQCQECGTDNKIVLQFHHRPGEVKVAEVMSLANSTKRFWEEVRKCDLVCANCHLIRHSEGR